MKRSGSAALAARCIADRARCPISSRCCQGRVQAGLHGLHGLLVVRPSVQRLCLANAHGRRRWSTSTAAWSLLWKRRLGNLKSSWVTSARLLFSSPFSHPRRPFFLLDSWHRHQSPATIHRRSPDRHYPASLVGKPLPVPRPFAATDPPAASLHARLAHHDQHLSAV